MSQRRFPPPWTIEKIPGGFRVVDANKQAIAYLYSCKAPGDANIAGVLTEDEAGRIASNIAKLPTLLGAQDQSELSRRRLRSAPFLPPIGLWLFARSPNGEANDGMRAARANLRAFGQRLVG